MKPVWFPEEGAFFEGPEGGIAHSVSLWEDSLGTIHAVWYQGSQERAADVRIFHSRKGNKGTGWSEPTAIQSTPGKSDANPVIFETRDGLFHFISSVLFGREWTDSRLMHRLSRDRGFTWNEPVPVSGLEGWLVRNKPIEARDGSFILPVYDERDWTSAALIRDPKKGDWRLGEKVPADTRLIQPTFIENRMGGIVALLRTGHESDALWRSASRDGGHTWSPAIPTTLPNNNSSVDAVRLRNGHFVLAFNDSTGPRTPLSLGLSTEEGLNFREIRNLEEGHGEFSYPSIIQARDDTLYVGYSHQKCSIKIVALDEEWITRRPSRIHEENLVP